MGSLGFAAFTSIGHLVLQAGPESLAAPALSRIAVSCLQLLKPLEQCGTSKDNRHVNSTESGSTRNRHGASGSSADGSSSARSYDTGGGGGWGYCAGTQHRGRTAHRAANRPTANRAAGPATALTAHPRAFSPGTFATSVLQSPWCGGLLLARRLPSEPEPFEDEYDDDEYEDGEWVDLDERTDDLLRDLGVYDSDLEGEGAVGEDEGLDEWEALEEGEQAGPWEDDEDGDDGNEEEEGKGKRPAVPPPPPSPRPRRDWRA